MQGKKEMTAKLRPSYADSVTATSWSPWSKEWVGNHYRPARRVYYPGNTFTKQSMEIETDDSGQENLDISVQLIQRETLQGDVINLGNTFIQDVQDRICQFDTQYLTSL